MSTTLAPAVIETAIKPKPTKDEILTAMAQLHIEKLKKKNEERKIKHEAVTQKIEKILIKASKKAGALSEPSVNWSDYGEGPRAYVNYTFRGDAISDEVKALMKIEKATHSICIPCLYEAKKQVRAAMGELVSKNDRVNALLTDKASRAALEKALETMSV